MHRRFVDLRRRDALVRFLPPQVASRVEGLTKAHGVDLLVSGSTWAQLRARFEGVRVAEQLVKGRAEPVVVFTVRDPPT